jgi:4-amino-4-deoxy-L-arabinose transferase-like glycosyltransferase
MLTKLKSHFINLTQGILLAFISITLLIRLLLWSLLRDSELNFLEPDSRAYYLPAASKFSELFLSSEANSNFLGAQVTPVFPLFLHGFSFLTISQVVFINLAISMATAFLIYKIGKEISGTSFGLLCAFIFSIEGSIWFSSLIVAPETLFTFFITLFLYFLISQPFSKSILNYTVAGLSLGISILTRPIGIVILVSIVIGLLVFPGFRNMHFVTLLIVASFIVIIWIARNFFIYGVPNVSTISGHNLLYYEGAAAQADSLKITLEESQKIEQGLRDSVIGSTASISEIYEYNMERGISLMQLHPLSLAKTHLMGGLRTIFGPGEASIERILLNGLHIQGGNIGFLSTLIFQIVVVLIVIGASIGAVKLWSTNKQLFLIFACTAGSLLIASSGSIGYSRFRVPMVPILAILCAGGVREVHLILRGGSQALRKYLSKKIST